MVAGFTFNDRITGTNGLRALSNTKFHRLGVGSSCLLARISNGFGDCTRARRRVNSICSVQ